MNTDHDFKIGSTHDTCEDYAVSGGHGPFAYAIVCDGCSSADDVDFGARMLALAARETLKIARNSPLSYEQFGSLTVHRADTVSSILPQIDPNFLDATLLIAWVDNGQLTALIYGDGVFLHKTAESVHAVHVEFKVPMEGVMRAAPAYLSYLLDTDRKASYDDLGGTKEINDCIIKPAGNDLVNISGSLVPHKPFDPVIITAPVAPGDIIAVCSDGINSFRHADDTPVPWTDLVKEYVGFKNYEGVFVQRRMAAFRRKCQKDFISHTDDISVAAIAV